MKVVKQTPPTLKHLADFEKVLEHYSPSSNSLEILRSIPTVLLVGPTAAGRNTLIDLLIQTGRYYSVVSDTTRPPRRNNGILEQNGVEYWFKSEDDFLDGLRNGGYIEAAVIHQQQVSGINISRLEEAYKSGKIAVNEVEIVGARNVHNYAPNILFIFLLPPDFETWMKRLKDRGDMSYEELRRRLVSAKDEIAEALKADYYQFVVNNEIHEAALAVDKLANGRQIDKAKQQTGRNHAEQLVIDVQLYLNA